VNDVGIGAGGCMDFQKLIHYLISESGESEWVEFKVNKDDPQPIYPNKQLAEAMVNLNMIDTIGSGIKRMFISQRNRYMPLPEYEISKEKQVKVKLIGKILDGEYTKILMKNNDLPLSETILLDKVQKRHEISKNAHQLLKKMKLVEGRYPNLFVSSEIANKIGHKVEYQKFKAFNNAYYKDMILAFILKNGEASPQEIKQLINDKLSDILSEEQKINKIRNVIFDMAHRDKNIRNIGGRGNQAKWVLNK
jgi:ATP-dependent DNA helicase RecG